MKSVDEAASSILNPGVHVAILRSTGDKKYYGGGMQTTVYKPVVQDRQYSSSRIKFQNGPDSIAAGWVTKDSSCYNVYCPGFVIVSHDIPIDTIFQPVSQRGGAIFLQRFFIHKDVVTGDWVLVVGFENKVVGFWPKTIFTGLSDFANYAEWGGEVYSPYGVDPPPMGSGCRPVGDVKLDGYAKQITVIDEDGKVDYDPSDCEAYSDDIDMYTVINQETVGGDLQYLVEFGGNHCLAECKAN
ncbi:unnamed protein product [Linum tenue]|uniref:Neprosin PEP catalytic domain-containing protein n=1 Tax=Linum tenue TaxID=586396 RepID=A0AAV0NUY0_9ROSI|nr:unnamed protein product [Linum tenue]